MQGKAAPFPFLYRLDQVARRYGVWPGFLNLHDPEALRWFRRAEIFMAAESDLDRGLKQQPISMKDPPDA